MYLGDPAVVYDGDTATVVLDDLAAFVRLTGHDVLMHYSVEMMLASGEVHGPPEKMSAAQQQRRKAFAQVISASNRTARALFQQATPCAGDSFAPPGLVALAADPRFGGYRALVAPGADVCVPGTAALVWASAGTVVATLVYDTPEGGMSEPKPLSMAFAGRWEIRVSTGTGWAVLACADVEDPADCYAVASRVASMTDTEANLIEAALLA